MQFTYYFPELKQHMLSCCIHSQSPVCSVKTFPFCSKKSAFLKVMGFFLPLLRIWKMHVPKEKFLFVFILNGFLQYMPYQYREGYSRRLNTFTKLYLSLLTDRANSNKMPWVSIHNFLKSYL